MPGRLSVLADRWFRPVLRLLFALNIVLAASGSLPAQDDAPAALVAALVRNLGDNSYAERARADEQLLALGAAARPALELATRDSDPEIRLRAKDLLRRLQVEQLWQSSAVHIDAAQLSASEVFAAIAEQSGNRILLGDQYATFHDEAITLPAEGGGFFPLLDSVCRQCEARIRPHYDTRELGLVVISGSANRAPTAYAGPVRAQLTSARRVFSEDLDYEAEDFELTHSFQLNLHLMWEDRFRLVAYQTQPELIEAVTDVDLALQPAQQVVNGWNLAGPATRQLSMSLRLSPPPTRARALRRLKLEWGLLAVADFATLTVDRLEPARPFYQDDVELVIEQIDESPGRVELTLLILRDLVVPDPAEVLLHENEIVLRDEQGEPYRVQGQSTSLTDQGARLRVSFVSPGSESQPGRLEFHYPRIRSQREVILVFEDVPLPAHSPD